MVRTQALWNRGKPYQLARLGADWRIHHSVGAGYAAHPLLSGGPYLRGCNAGRQLHRDLFAYNAGRLALALGRKGLAHRQIALLVHQAPFVEIREHDPRRLLGKIGSARQADILAQLLIDLSQRVGRCH